jgi:hypothetical protein
MVVSGHVNLPVGCQFEPLVAPNALWIRRIVSPANVIMLPSLAIINALTVTAPMIPLYADLSPVISIAHPPLVSLQCFCTRENELPQKTPGYYKNDRHLSHNDTI